MSALWNLSRIRLSVQLLMLLLTVYGGLVLGHYLADKLSTALPALSCAFDQQNGAYCTLIPFQHQFHHRVGEVIARTGEFAIATLVPMAFTFLSFYLLFFLLNKAFCGWICPLGTLQELLYRLGRMLRRPFHRITGRGLHRVRPVKWLILLGLVFLLPLLTGLGHLPHAAGDAFCQICPSRIATTLLVGDAKQVAVNTTSASDFIFGALRAALFGFVIIAALTVRQPFCRICPMLALHALLRRLAPLRLRKLPDNGGKGCGSCDLCVRACPMDIPEVASEQGSKVFHEDCTLCGRCVEFCPKEDRLQLAFGPWALFRSRLSYFRRRTRYERPEGDPKESKP
uniref:Putative 4Fe-4S ferredoxin, iron-sulfur binding protein n=1 Tax=Magnetococcus massalia (strain MO-1) TaxID=451514 RepID=A0A1S7LC75_MAGMO|nr:Putative 4Fe-4S ferredoxin, iron-sulfur binding protein [Candidatus Magnetococcus massalia]